MKQQQDIFPIGQKRTRANASQNNYELNKLINEACVKVEAVLQYIYVC